MVTTAANVIHLTLVPELFHVDEVAYDAAGYQGIAKTPAMAGHSATLRVAIRLGKHHALPKHTNGKLQDLIMAAKEYLRDKGEKTFRVIKQQY